MKNSTQDTPRWWENEPLLIAEVSMATHPGYTWESNWQERDDGREEVALLDGFGALQTHLLNVMSGHNTNRFCYFKSDQFKEQRRDYLAVFLEAARAKGIRSIVYFNVHAIKPDFGEDKPEWRQISYGGKPITTLYQCETSMCVNTGFRDWVRDVCLDLCKYPIDGIFFDGPVLFRGCCYCDACRALYREKYGEEMPRKIPGDPKLKQLAAFQSESLRRFIAHADAAVKAARPDVAVFCNAGKREEPYYAVGRNNRVLIRSLDVLGAEGGFHYNELSGQPVWNVGSNAKYYQTQADGKPTVAFVSAAHGPWRAFPLSEPELCLATAQAPIHGSGVWFAGFRRSYTTPAFQAVGDQYRFFAQHRDCYFHTRSLARVAIVWPEDSINFYGIPEVSDGDFTQGGQKAEVLGDIHEEFNGFYDALIKSHIPCDILDEESIRRGGLEGYDLVILPNVACTDAQVDDNLRAYVRAGGNLIASFETALCNDVGRRGETSSLADLLGVTMQQTPLTPFPHFYFFRNGETPEVFADIDDALLPAPLVNCETALNGAVPLSLFSRKFKGWDGSEILPSEYPAITLNRFGRGRVVYLAGAFGGLYWKYKQRPIRLLLRNLFGMLSPPRVSLEHAPTSVELVHRCSRDGARELMHLVNYTGGLTRPFENLTSLKDVTLRVETDHTVARALKLGVGLDTRREDGCLRMTLPRLEVFETIVLTRA